MLATSPTASQGMARRGALIVIEGLDRSGKSTQSALLAKALAGAHATTLGTNKESRTHSQTSTAVELRRFPDRTTPIGQMIDSYLKGTQEVDARTIHQLFAVNRSEAMQSMRNTLENGTSIILDRYAFSGVAYTVAKEIPGLSTDWCKGVDSGLIKPDLVIYLDIFPKTAAQRGGFGQERYEKSHFLEKVRTCFLSLAKEDKDLWVVLDATTPKEELHQAILNLCLKTLARCQSTPLSPLWA